VNVPWLNILDDRSDESARRHQRRALKPVHTRCGMPVPKVLQESGKICQPASIAGKRMCKVGVK
jgi:hypothetical protein